MGTPPSPQERRAAPLTYWTQPYPMSREHARAIQLALREGTLITMEDRSSMAALVTHVALETSIPAKTPKFGDMKLSQVNLSDPRFWVD